VSKKDQGKPEPALTYYSLICEISAVRKYGIAKYGAAEDWLTTEPMRHFNAALRHIYAYLEGAETDDASGCSHLAHAVTNLMFEIERKHRLSKEK